MLPHPLPRREMLRLLRTALVGSALASSPSLHAATRADKRPVALLLPLTGAHAGLGTSMANAASLAQNAGGALLPIDTCGTPAAAAAAVKTALGKRAGIILGPLTADEVPAVAAAVAGRVPVVSFTNDAAQAATGAFVFGVTPAQATSAILRYARGRGIRSLVAIGDGSPWTAAAAAAARGLEGELGLTVRSLEVRPGQPIPAAGDAPDAVLLPGSGESLIAAARGLQGTGVQLLGTLQGVDNSPAALAALDGAWLASLEPEKFGGFSGEFVQRHGGQPGALAALAHDAAAIALELRLQGRLDRAGLLSGDGWPGIAGAVRFRTDGSVARELAIVVARPGGYETVATATGA